MSTMPQVLRLCASVERMPESVNDRSTQKDCAECGRKVWYDPAASIPSLGPEHIVCDICLDAVYGITE